MQQVQEIQVWSLGQEDPLEEEMATHSSILAWEIPWTEDPGRQRVGHDLVTRHTSNDPMTLTVLWIPGLHLRNWGSEKLFPWGYTVSRWPSQESNQEKLDSTAYVPLYFLAQWLVLNNSIRGILGIKCAFCVLPESLQRYKQDSIIIFIL